MPDALALSIDSKSLQRQIARLKKLGGDVDGTMMKVVDRGCEMIVIHMKGSHFFVGTGKEAGAKAKDNEFTFVNPDGTPRFKSRTVNLVNSMQSRGAEKSGKDIRGKVFVTSEYAKSVDEGGPGRRAFPFKRPAIENVRPRIKKEAVQMVAVEVRKANGRG